MTSQQGVVEFLLSINAIVGSRDIFSECKAFFAHFSVTAWNNLGPHPPGTGSGESFLSSIRAETEIQAEVFASVETLCRIQP